MNRNNNKVNLYIVLIFISILSFSPLKVFSWGARGHSVICEAAIHGVKNKDLKNYLLHQTLTLAYLCNIPDTYWRKGPQAEIGSPTHFIEPDLVGGRLEDVPVKFADYVAKYSNKTNLIKQSIVFSVPQELGSSWWRTEQFFNLAIQQKNINDMLIYMGIMGHFVGDTAQPLHNTSNYDGWQNNHGGLHSFYENQIVINMEADLLVKVTNALVTAEKELKLDKNSPNIVEKMKALSILSFNDLKELFKIDSKYLIEPSQLKFEKGMDLKTPAKRKDPTIVKNGFEKLVIKHMARAATQLAHFWDQVYIEASKKPDSVGLFDSKINRYDFPHTPAFVVPDYLDKK